MMTKIELHELRTAAVDKYAAYIHAEIRLWEKDGFINLPLYKAFKKSKSAFHIANNKWEAALVEYAANFH
jgi:hypothetical protein